MLDEAESCVGGSCAREGKEVKLGVDRLMGVDWESVVEERPAVAARVGRIEVPEPRLKMPATTQSSVEAESNGTSRVRPFAIIFHFDILKAGVGVIGVWGEVLGGEFMRKGGGGRWCDRERG